MYAFRILVTNTQDQIADGDTGAVVMGEFGRVENVRRAFSNYEVSAMANSPESFARGDILFFVQVRETWDSPWIVPATFPWFMPSVSEPFGSDTRPSANN